GLGSGSFGLAATWALYNTFMPLLLAPFVSSAGLRGTIMALDNVIAVLMLPLVGAWSDRVKGPLGKRLPFLLVGMPLAGLLFAALPLADTTLFLLLAVDVVFLLTITLFRAPLVALMPDHVPPGDRGSANGVITLMAAAGGAVGLLLLAPLFAVAQGLPLAGAGGRDGLRGGGGAGRDGVVRVPLWRAGGGVVRPGAAAAAAGAAAPRPGGVVGRAGVGAGAGGGGQGERLRAVDALGLSGR